MSVKVLTSLDLWMTKEAPMCWGRCHPEFPCIRLPAEWQALGRCGASIIHQPPRKGRPCNLTDGETEAQRGWFLGSGQTATEAGVSPGLWGSGGCAMLQSDLQKEEVSQEGKRSRGSSLSQSRMAHPTLNWGGGGGGGEPQWIRPTRHQAQAGPSEHA